MRVVGLGDSRRGAGRWTRERERDADRTVRLSVSLCSLDPIFNPIFPLPRRSDFCRVRAGPAAEPERAGAAVSRRA